MKKHFWKNPQKIQIKKKERKCTENWGFWKHFFFLKQIELQYPFNTIFSFFRKFWMQWNGIV